MLTALRSKSAGWVAKIFIAVLAMSFAVWGVSDIFRGYRADSLAVVGDREISVEEYQEALRQRLRRLSDRAGRVITREEARQSGVGLQVLSDLVRQAALESQAQTLGLAVPDSAIARRVMAIPAFQNAAGQFDRQAFLRLLAANGLSEQQFVALQRGELLRGAVASVVDRQFTVPETLIKAVFDHRNSQRTARYLSLPMSLAGEVEAPSDAEIADYYERHKRTFTAPEFRTLSLLRLEAEDLADTVEVSEEEVRQAYEVRKEELSVPERRQVLQIPFENEAAAKEARAKLATGADFATLAEERGLTEEDYSLGWVTHREIPDSILADAAFSLREGEVSQPVEGRLAVVLVKVTGIEPGRTKPFEEVRGEIETALKIELAKEEILTIHDRIEDERAGGATVREAGNRFNLPLIQVDAVDREGNGPDGEPVNNIPVRDRVVSVAFESDVGVENDPIETENEGFVWVDVIEVTPEAVRPLEEVRDEVVAQITEQRKRDALRTRAEEIVAEIEGGKTLDQVAEEISVAPSTTRPLRRSDTEATFGESAVTALFDTPQGKVTTVYDPAAGAYQIIQTTRVTVPAFEPGGSEAQALQRILETNMADDVFAQYMVDLERRLGTQLNEQAWSSINADQS